MTQIILGPDQHKYAKAPHNFTAVGVLVIVSICITLAVAFACSYSLGAIGASLQDGLKISREVLGLTLGLAIAGPYYAAPIGSGLSSRIGHKATIGLGMIGLGASLVLGACVNSVAPTLLVLGVGVGLSLGMIFSPSMSVASTWFPSHRGLIAGLATSGLSTGAFAGPLITIRLNEALGWRSALMLLGATAIISGLCMAPLISAASQTKAPTRSDSASIVEIAPGIRLLLVTSALAGFAALAPMAHLTSSAIDKGIDPIDAATLLAASGLAAIPGRTLLGVIADRLGRSRLLSLCYAGLALSFLLWSHASTFSSFLIFATLYGICYGSSAALRIAVLADLVPQGRRDALMSRMLVLLATGTIAGPWLFGLARDRLGTYDWPICVSVGVCVCCALLSAMIQPPHKQ